MATRYRRSPDAMSAEVGDDVVALQAVRGFAYGMEDVTAAVWHQLDRPVTLDEITARLMEQYEVSEAQCRTDIGELLGQLVGEGLVDEVPA